MRNQQANTDTIDTKLLLRILMAFKKGDFTVRLPAEWTGEAGKIADALNEVIDLNERTAKELERVSRVVGREGKITQRVSVPSASGTWISVVDSVNELIDDMA